MKYSFRLKLFYEQFPNENRYTPYHDYIAAGYRELLQPEIFQQELDYDIVGSSDCVKKNNTAALALHMPAFFNDE
ncbi:MAG: hypothetical protein H7Z13_10830 [Ferruginibacter sp.]|nr:hypothetical protein [Ferruginibacter sp.]